MAEKSNAYLEIPFNRLNDINVSGHTEQKGKFTYLSWVWAWEEVMKIYPDSFAKVYETENGMNYFTDGRTAWVKVGFTIVDGDYSKENIEYYPIYNYQHKSLPLDQVTSHDVNTAIQRGLTKAIARHGLGLYVYAGEDLPDVDKGKVDNDEERKKLLLEYTRLRNDLNGLGIDFRATKTEKYILETTGLKNQGTGLSNEEMNILNDCYADMIRQAKEAKNEGR